MYIGKQKTPMSVLEKKVPRNPKYSNVRGSLDTGCTVNKLKVITTKEFLKRQNEIFSRIKPRDLAEALELEPFYVDADASDGQEWKQASAPNSPDQQQLDDERSLLLLDLRDLGEFKTCHIKTAKSYPLANINQQRFTTEMYRMKNKEGKLIVVYDDDERVANLGATGLVERGFENVQMLSGGLKVFGNMMGHLLNGELPEHLIRKKPLSPTESTSTRRERRRAGSPRDSTYAPSVSGFTGCSVHSVVSHRSTFSRAPRFPQDRSNARQHKEIVQKLHHTSTGSFMNHK